MPNRSDLAVISRDGERGRVYVVDVADSVRGYPARFAFTSTEDKSRATYFPREEAEELARTRSWRGARVEGIR